MDRRILILAGPSAVGKTTVMDSILNSDRRFSLVRSATTRAPRGDSHDSEYIYLTKEEFLRRVDSGMMLEYMEYADNLYGTPASEIERIFKCGKIPILILDLQGVISLKKKKADYSVIAAYMYAPLSVLRERLYIRAMADGLSDKAISAYRKRVEQNKNDYRFISSISDLFDFFIENKEIEKTRKAVLDRFFSDADAKKSKCSENVLSFLLSEADGFK